MRCVRLFMVHLLQKFLLGPISCICLTAAFVQIQDITSILIWSWLSLMQLDGDKKPGLMLMFQIELACMRTHLTCRLSKFELEISKAWIPRIVFFTATFQIRAVCWCLHWKFSPGVLAVIAFAGSFFPICRLRLMCYYVTFFKWIDLVV